MIIHPDERVRPHVRLAAFLFRNVQVLPQHEALDLEIKSLQEDYLRRFPSLSAATEALKPTRQMYAAVGIDPTKNRPSSEALLRRVLQGKGLYRVNSVVDCFNLLSLKFFVPVGLYDVDAVRGEVVFRLGHDGESYAGIGKDEVHLDGRYCLADASGPFGNPSADSYRTRITLDTTNVLAIFFLPCQSSQTKELMETVPETFLRFHRGVHAASF